jgi:Ca2+-binding RTX toxin-like protein
MAVIKQVVGTSANDTLDGGLGTNEFRELAGGGGNDTYLVDMGTAGATTPDKVLELPGRGIDTVVLVGDVNGAGVWNGNAASTYVLPDQVENLSLQGPVVVNLNGSPIDTVFPDLFIVGNNLNNRITTGNGDDTLYGGLGDDVLSGGGGSDTYFVNSARDVVIEGSDSYFLAGGAGAAIDTVNSFAPQSLGNGVENLVFDRRAGNVTGKGNSLANVIQGSDGNNLIDGGDGDDQLFGNGGADSLKGGNGNDVLDGSDLTGTAFTEFDPLALAVPVAAPSSIADKLDGGAGDDVLLGFDQDTLLGGGGNDTLNGDAGNTPNEKILMDGGAGDDLFQNFAVRDLIKGGKGIDTVQIDFGAVPTTYTLPGDVERGILANGATTVDTLTGNSLDNYLQGNAGNDRLVGLAGEDVLDGGLGADQMAGGDGDDSYMVDNLGDSVIEVGSKSKGGSGDTVYSYIANYALGANVENLVLEEGTYAGGTGGAAVNGKGNELDNLIVGNSRANLLEGGAGNDTLDGGTGADVLIGGSGSDTYVVDRTSDVIQELSDVTGANTDTVLLVDDLTVAPLPAFLGVRYVLPDNVENLDASAITRAYDAALDQPSLDITLEGNRQANKLTGSMLNDTFIGGEGNDTMTGGAGNDTYYVQNSGDGVFEQLAGAAGGTDTIVFSASLGASSTFKLPKNVENLIIADGSAGKFVGNPLDNLMVGSSASNVIDGGAGNDTLQGEGGDDTLTDKAGNNLFDGGAGNDTMKGGKGNDTYYVDTGDGAGSAFPSASEDTIVDAGGKADTVRSFVTSYTLAAGLERLELLDNALDGTGSADNNTIVGNAGNNRLDGQSGNDTLDGGTGADRLIGGTGNDTFSVDDAGDTIEENSAATGGIDTVISSIDFNLQDTDGSGTLGGGVENLTLSPGAPAALQATGNALVNVLTGNEFDNLINGGTLDGGSGSPDTLIGGDGNDTYLIDSVGDRITEADNKLFPAAGTADVVYAMLADGSSYVMDKNVEQVHLLKLPVGTPAGNVKVTGNDSANFIWGGFGDNVIAGGLDNDAITGGAGKDNLDGGAGDDVLDGDGLYQDSFGGAWIVASGGFDTMAGGAGNDTYFVDVGDGAGTGTAASSEDTVIEAAGGGVDTVKLMGATRTSYRLDAEVENLDLSGLTGGLTVSAIGNAKDNVFTGQKAPGNNVVQGGEGNDTFNLTLVNNANDVVRGGYDAGLPGGTTTGDVGSGDILKAKVDSTGGATAASTDIKQIEAVSLDVSGMTVANDFTWTLSNFADASNFGGNPAAGGLAPVVTVTGGVTGGQATAPDTSSTTVLGNITLTGLTTTPTYVLSNYNQAANLDVTTTLTLANHGGTTDVLDVVLDNHRSGGLASVGIETLKLTSTGNVLDNSTDANVINVSAVTATTATTLIDAIGDSSLQILGLTAATAAGSQQTVSLHDFDGASFAMRMAGTGGTNFLALRLDNVETSLTTDAGALENFSIDVGGSQSANILNGGNANIADLTYVSGGADSNLTLSQWRGAISTVALTGFSTGFTGRLAIVGTNSVTLTADGGDISFRPFRNSTLQDEESGDDFTFNVTGSGNSSLDSLDNIDGGGGTDRITATLDGLESTTTGRLDIANVEELNFNLSNGKSASIDASRLVGAVSVNIGGTATAGNTLSIDNLVTISLDASGFAGNLDVSLVEWDSNHAVIAGSGNDTLTFAEIAGFGSPASINDFDLTAGGTDTLQGGTGSERFTFGTTLTVDDQADGGAGDDRLSFTDATVAGNDLDNVRNVENIILGDAATTITTVDDLVRTGILLTVDGTAVSAGLGWDGSAETDGSFFVTAGSGADTLKGGAGNDSLVGGNGADNVQGNAGDDLIVMAISAGNIDVLDGGAGNDTLSLVGSPAGTVVIDLTNATDQLVSINGVAEASTQVGFENVDASAMGGSSAITVTAAATGSQIIGGAGADILNGGGGDDTLDGGSGVDTINAGGGDDLILWDKAQDDILDAGAGTDTLKLVTTTTGNIAIDLSQGVDQISSAAGNQAGFENIDASELTTGELTAIAAATGSSLTGGGADDTLTSGVGADTLTGGDGADHFVFVGTTSGTAYDVVTDFLSGTDIIDLSHVAFPAITTAGSAGGTEISPAEFAWGDITSSGDEGVYLVYNNVTGDLYYDADANGDQTGLLIAHFSNVPAISAVDIHIVA